MDLIAACVAVASFVVILKPAAFLKNHPVASVESTYIPVDGISVTPNDPALPAREVKKTRHPLQALANLGIASWYGSVLHGHKTASGETFDKDALTACHRTLPFGTMVRVVDVTSGKSVVVRINDRGVLSPDRIIDLSSAAAQNLGILRAGVAHVRLEILKKVERRVEKPPFLEEAQLSTMPSPVPTL